MTVPGADRLQLTLIVLYAIPPSSLSLSTLPPFFFSIYLYSRLHFLTFSFNLFFLALTHTNPTDLHTSALPQVQAFSLGVWM